MGTYDIKLWENFTVCVHCFCLSSANSFMRFYTQVTKMKGAADFVVIGTCDEVFDVCILG